MLVILSVLVGIAALFGWMSERVLKLPNTIGTMLLTAITSIALVALAPVWPEPHKLAVSLIGQIDFQRLILHGMLAMLLFAGAYLLDLKALLIQRIPVFLLAVCSTVLSVLIVGMLTYFVSHFFGYHGTMLECFLFGALISPTDPIAVLEMLRRVSAPKHLEAQLAGESLFNDGVGAVIFLALLAAATQGEMPTVPHILGEIVIAAGGGILLGCLLAVPVSLFMRTICSPPVDILLSLSLALGGYAIADHMGISAPLETVAAALALRTLTENVSEDRIARHDINHFWSHIDEIQNSILFVLLGCGFLVVAFHRNAVFLGMSEILIVNFARVASVAFVILALRLIRSRHTSSLTVLSWGGLRGGLSIALALTIPASYGGGWIVTSTYVLVVFSVLVQGGTMDLFLKRYSRTHSTGS